MSRRARAAREAHGQRETQATGKPADGKTRERGRQHGSAFPPSRSPLSLSHPRPERLP